MKVTVVMSFYNEELTVFKKAIKSLLDQTFKDFEVIVISDNPSNKKCIDYMTYISEIDKRFKLILNSRNKGLVFCLNKGLELSSGEYIIRMDADDISYPERIQFQVDFMEQNNDCALMGTEIRIIDENGEICNNPFKDKRGKKMKNIKRIMRFGNIFIHPTLILRKKDIVKIGGYRNISYAEDYDLALRCIDAGLKVHISKNVLLDYRIRKNSISRLNQEKQKKSVFRLLNSYHKNKISMYKESEILSLSELEFIENVKFSIRKYIFIFLMKNLR